MLFGEFNEAIFTGFIYIIRVQYVNSSLTIILAFAYLHNCMANGLHLKATISILTSKLRIYNAVGVCDAWNVPSWWFIIMPKRAALNKARGNSSAKITLRNGTLFHWKGILTMRVLGTDSALFMA